MAGAAARFSRRRCSQRHALRLPDPVAEAPEPNEAGAWPPLGAAGPRARLYGGSAAELRCTRRRAVGAARRRSCDRLGLSAADAGLCRGDPYLLFAMGLSLSGVVDFGARLAGTGSRLSGRSGLTSTFFAGVLATVVATPCTAPFMGAALGFALIAPA